MLIIRGKIRNKTLKKPIIYKILNEMKHKKQRFHRKESNKQFYIQTRKERS